MNKSVNLPNELASIRLNTNHDLADAQALASHLLDRIVFRLRRMSYDLLTAVLMSNAYTQENKTLDNVLFFLTDPDWDSKIQIIYSFAQEKSLGNNQTRQRGASNSLKNYLNTRTRWRRI